MEILKNKYTITELSKHLNVTDHTLRYYEREFGISVPKDSRGRRFYSSELANLMYQIKNMRDEGLEIKAIRKILANENIIPEPPPVVIENDNTTTSVAPRLAKKPEDLQEFFSQFKNELTMSIIGEISDVKDKIIREIHQSKLELGACVENSARKVESKLDEHFKDVDHAASGRPRCT